MVQRHIFIFICCTFFILPLFGWFWFTKEPEPIVIKEEPKPEPIKPTFTLTLYPADDSREIEEEFERNLTLQCAEKLKQAIESNLPYAQVIVSKTNEGVSPLQSASAANRQNVNLYISLHFCKNSSKGNKLYLYYPLYNPATDFWPHHETNLSLTPYTKAYKNNVKVTKAWATHVSENLKQAKGFSFEGIFGIPFKPVAGVVAPTFGIECCIYKSEDHKFLVNPLAKALTDIIKPFEPEKKIDEPQTDTVPLSVV